MTKEEILACADFAWQQGMGTLMLQSGELPTPQRIECVRAVPVLWLCGWCVMR